MDETTRRAIGLPGVPESGQMPPEVLAMEMTRKPGPRITPEDVKEATEILAKYKQGKANLESRVVEDELWWELRHWEAIGRTDAGRKYSQKLARLDPSFCPKDAAGTNVNPAPHPSSAWLFNAILNKHADAMDNFPEPMVLPRERSDEQSAKVLSSVLPVILEYNDYEQTYSDNWWEKLKHGTAAYGVFWNSEKENGLGDVDIRQIDLLNLFWEPGVTDIQASRNLFIVDLVDEDLLDQQYPDHRGKMKGGSVDVKSYLYDDTVDTSHKAVVVDWYYKKRVPSGRTVLHYVKFVGNELLYASENDPAYADRGFYDHGRYPIVLDVLFPEKGTPAGFGYVAICKDPQLYIDKLSANILESSMQATKRRHFISNSTGINEDEFLDWSKPFIHVEGELDDRRLRELAVQPISAVYLNVMQMKIEEMKDTAANRDVNSGGYGSGVTAASAIAALQEAGNKASRDMISTAYRAHVEIAKLCVELIRQFYDEARSFRISGTMPGQYDFIEVDNQGLREQPMGVGMDGTPLYRLPVFDLKIKAQRTNPFSRMEQNERAKELYGMGFFNPDRAQEALGALDMMDFEGIEKVKERVAEGQTLANIVQQMAQQLDQMAAIIQATTGYNMGIDQGGEAAPPPGEAAPAGGGGINDRIMQAQQPRSGYTERLVKRSSVNMDDSGSAAAPR